MTLKVYGIKNCNTMKKSFDFLNQAGIAYEFVDYKKVPPDALTFADWVAQFGLDKLINKQGTTYKRLDEESRALIAGFDGSAESLTAVFKLVHANPSMIKRPIVVGEYQGQAVALIGFKEDAFAQAFGLGLN